MFVWYLNIKIFPRKQNKDISFTSYFFFFLWNKKVLILDISICLIKSNGLISWVAMITSLTMVNKRNLIWKDDIKNKFKRIIFAFIFCLHNELKILYNKVHFIYDAINIQMPFIKDKKREWNINEYIILWRKKWTFD